VYQLDTAFDALLTAVVIVLTVTDRGLCLREERGAEVRHRLFLSLSSRDATMSDQLRRTFETIL
jgi:hypothetical protein